ncbi:hypothetical protein FRC98_15370 [Lujinxingia vulgaris]|uniref:Uncharacterized protein n=1 Tax=Lujinxingia vulgaris TaxID=2600176 RepID=A0A5C6X788_9DELT|nr:hypothetical protein [Lujinxingia vulgaris]TXD35587.1 hypothetical protein FRC98_15370 [Lujinxingia vulgaris]
MTRSADQLAEALKEALDTTFEVSAVEGAVSVNHVQARRRLAEIRPESSTLRVALGAEFVDRPELEGASLEAAGQEELHEEVAAFRARGYREQEAEQQPAASTEPESEETPVHVQMMERGYSSIDELVAELAWLAERAQRKR